MADAGARAAAHLHGRRHLAALEVRLTPRTGRAGCAVRSVVDGRVAKDNVAAYRLLGAHHVDVTEQGRDGQVAFVVVETLQSRVRVAVEVRRVARVPNGTGPPTVTAVDEPGVVGDELFFEVRNGHEVVVEKVAGVATSRDVVISEPVRAAVGAAGGAPSFAGLRDDYARAWEGLWRRFAVEVDGEAEEVLAVRAHLVHVLQTLSPHTIDCDAGVPARGLHGEAYRGHVFWDELFVLPLLDLRLPELTRSLLLYR